MQASVDTDSQEQFKQTMSDTSLPRDPKVEIQLLLQRIQELVVQNPGAAEEIALATNAIPAARSVRSLLMKNREKISYYSEEWGKAIKPVLDTMIATRNPQHFYLKDFPNLAKKTLYLRIYNSWLWLIDNQDPDGIYQKLKNETEISQAYATGIRIEFKDTAPAVMPAAPVNVSLDSIFKLQNKISEFLEKPLDHDMMFDEKGLSLNQEQIESIEAGLPPKSPPKFNWIVEHDRVRIMRIV